MLWIQCFKCQVVQTSTTHLIILYTSAKIFKLKILLILFAYATLKNLWLVQNGPFQSTVEFHVEISHLICSANQITRFYMKCNTLGWNGSLETLAKEILAQKRKLLANFLFRFFGIFAVLWKDFSTEILENATSIQYPLKYIFVTSQAQISFFSMFKHCLWGSTASTKNGPNILCPPTQHEKIFQLHLYQTKMFQFLRNWKKIAIFSQFSRTPLLKVGVPAVWHNQEPGIKNNAKFILRFRQSYQPSIFNTFADLQHFYQVPKMFIPTPYLVKTLSYLLMLAKIIHGNLH